MSYAKSIMLEESVVELLKIYKNALGKRFSYNSLIKHILILARMGDTDKIVILKLMRNIRVQVTRNYIQDLKDWDILPRFSSYEDLESVIALWFDGHFDEVIQFAESKKELYDANLKAAKATGLFRDKKVQK